MSEKRAVSRDFYIRFGKMMVFLLLLSFVVFNISGRGLLQSVYTSVIFTVFLSAESLMLTQDLVMGGVFRLIRDGGEAEPYRDPKDMPIYKNTLFKLFCFYIVMFVVYYLLYNFSILHCLFISTAYTLIVVVLIVHSLKI